MRMVRHRIGALVAVMCAVLGGAALVTGTAVLAESGIRSHVSAPRIAGADVVVSAAQTLPQDEDLPVALPERAVVPADLVGRLARLPGVTTAAGDVSFPVAAVDGQRVVPAGDAATAGHTWSSVALMGDPPIQGTPPTRPNDVALDAATANDLKIGPGGQAHLVVAGRPATLQVSAVVHGPARGVFFADQAAYQLAGRADGPHKGPKKDTVDLIGLRTQPGAAATVADEARKLGFKVSTGPDIGDIATPSAAAARSLLILIAGSLAGITLLIVGFIVTGALTVSIGGQRRELALLRAVGASPKQVRRLAAAQATVVSAVALVPGVLLGYALAGQFRSLLATLGVLPDALPLTISPLAAIAAVLLLLGVIQVAARLAAWRTSKMPATEAVAESRVEPKNPSPVRTRIGALLMVLATAMSVTPLILRNQFGAVGTATSGIVAAIGLALAGPALVRSLSGALARRLPSRVRATTWLAVSNSHGYALRVAGAVSTLAMAVLFTLTYTMTQTTMMSASSQDVDQGMRAQAVVAAPELGGLPAGTLDKIRATPGVRTAMPVNTTTVLWPHQEEGKHRVESQPALVLTPDAPAVLDLDVRAGSLAGLTGNTVAVSADTASFMDTAVGRDVDLLLGDGTPTKAKVVAVYGRGLGFGPMAISRDLAAGHFGTGLDQAVLVSTDGSAAGLAALGDQPGVKVDTSNPRAGLSGVGGAPPEVYVNLALLAVLLGYILLGVANKLVAGTTQRRHELAALRLVGTTPRQVRAMIRRESALISVVAVGTGLALSVIPLVLLGIGFLGRPWPAGPGWLAPATVLVVVAIAFLATELPARRALRTPPAQVLGSHE
ncbi:putative ABC transport system permease protein [Actinocrispum wychmicini]|uniref:Putative ABC transport system permease protein n=2 Tax=Actinocrispum wychmicini TaxID=1213861 RepID=A0A4R2J725_9PSEU|nr:putative ABC transport system permease protein [Actinocrispum wychmicini]